MRYLFGLFWRFLTHHSRRALPAYKTHGKNMQMEKRTLLLLLLGLVLLLCRLDASQAARRLRKKPRVYNALITTDDNLTSSRAYPVIQPTIHEPGYAPLGPYNPYGYYSPPLVRFGQPIVPGLTPNERLPYPLPTGAQYPSAGFAPYEQRQPVDAPVERPVEQQPLPQVAAPSLEPQEMTKEQMPLPLNEQGLPPVLIRLPSQYTGQPTHLPPYPYSQYPVIYDQQDGYVRQNYLPPYDYYPTQGYPIREPTAAATAPPAPPSPPKEEQPEPQPLPLELNLEPVQPSFEDIRNGSQSKNSQVPDVPPPPIPSGPRRPRPAEPDN
ncbi:vegetative cell wall protein gp1 [Drosophila obscura]|uniref:vegetative cell wall protein gp1 n=1 Tax=Drosophila obscura TaxID=7282 RepID=UPI001BB29E5D|nr:vegetative cell wall protein gp1 [Drosophila obscura]